MNLRRTKNKTCFLTSEHFVRIYAFDVETNANIRNLNSFWTLCCDLVDNHNMIMRKRKCYKVVIGDLKKSVDCGRFIAL